MTDRSKTGNLGTPVAVDIAAVEAELQSLWKSASARESEGAVIRACSCNLVVIARDRQEAETLLPVLGRLSEWHPCRTLVACHETDAEASKHDTGPHMHAWISAQCFLPFAGGPQVCSEVVTVAARGSATGDLLNTISSLLVPDLPVFLYWKSFQPEDFPAVEYLARFASLLIVDSHAARDDAGGRRELMQILQHPPANIAVRDLNWARLNAWRDTVAQFFDHPGMRQEAEKISSVEIERDIAAHGSIPTRTLLLTGWLASSLGWKLVSTEKTSAEWLSGWMGKCGEISVRFTGTVSGPSDAPGISAINLATRSGSTFRVVREKGAACLRATASGNGLELVHSVRQDSMDEATLLVRELSLSGRDESFRSALVEAEALEQRFGE
jgi:glucose-6-phosphate dehydrogenase assembly protein OpcA